PLPRRADSWPNASGFRPPDHEESTMDLTPGHSDASPKLRWLARVLRGPSSWGFPPALASRPSRMRRGAPLLSAGLGAALFASVIVPTAVAAAGVDATLCHRSDYGCVSSSGYIG